jgi:hypothetical protein
MARREPCREYATTRLAYRLSREHRLSLQLRSCDQKGTVPPILVQEHGVMTPLMPRAEADELVHYRDPGRTFV